MISRQPAKKRMRIASNAPITISSDSDSDIEDIEGDHHQLLWNLMKRNQDLSILPVRAPALERESRSISLVPNCTICNIEFGNMVALQNHVRQLHLKCVPCNRQFSNLQLAQAHKMLHQHPSQLQQRGRWNVQTDFLLQEDNDYIFGGWFICLFHDCSVQNLWINFQFVPRKSLSVIQIIKSFIGYHRELIEVKLSIECEQRVIDSVAGRL